MPRIPFGKTLLLALLPLAVVVAALLVLDRKEEPAPPRSDESFPWSGACLPDDPPDAPRESAGVPRPAFPDAPEAGPRRGGTSLLVVGPDGEPVVGGAVSVVSKVPFSSSPYGRTTAVRNGRAEVSVLSNSTEDWLEIYGARSAGGALLAHRRIGPSVPKTGGLRVELTESVSIEGRVVDENHRGRWNAHVVAVIATVPLKDHYRTRMRCAARTDKEGRFRIDGLCAEDYRVSVRPDPWFLRREAVLARGGAQNVTIKVAEGLKATVRVNDPDGMPVRRFKVILIDSLGDRRTSTGYDGKDGIGGLDPDQKYTLRLIPDSKLRLAPMEIADWTPGDIEVRLRRGGRVSGKVVGPDGERLLGTHVWWREANGEWQSAEFYDRGKFICRSVFSEEIALRAGLKGSLIDDADVVEVTAKNGAEDVVLRVDPGLTLEVALDDLSAGASGRAALVEEGPEPLRRLAQRRKGNDWFVFRGLRPGRTYTFLMVGAGDQAALVRGLRPEDRSVTVKLRPGLSIQGRVRLPPGNVWAAVTAEQNGLSTSSTVDKTGHFKITGLTEGAWRVTVFARLDDSPGSLTGEATVEAGGSAEIELQPAR